ncbi:hypothetical protein AURDEDRAFT_164040 [Auricularia subglabra TFB-10046 SS5]|nr:hypothetical protein AURDEDRAFT_164040 [Auricularia subglabra TFB-10046 SS5]
MPSSTRWRWHWRWRRPTGYEAISLEAVESVAAVSRRHPSGKGLRWKLLLAFVSVLCGAFVGALTVLAWRPTDKGQPLPALGLFGWQLPIDRLGNLLALFTARNDALPSASWAPLVLSECTPNMQFHHAPCVAARDIKVAYGEELVYPDFRLREPVFAPSRAKDDRQAWHGLINGIRERAALCQDDQWVCYRGQYGQNIIVINSTYAGKPRPDSWSDQTCMGDGVSIAGLEFDPTASGLTEEEFNAKFPVDRLVIATSPDSWSFQHFLDRVTHIMLQGEHLNRGFHGDVVTGRHPGGSVEQMWDMLGYGRQGMHYNGGCVSAKTILFSCRAPLIHPWLSLRTLEAFGLPSIPAVPVQKRKTIMYCSRSHGKGIMNGGRRVLNEEELLRDIRQLLKERNQGEELVLFDPDAYGSQPKLMKWFHDNVRAIIGPHGGALFNHRWAGPDTLLLEMMPTTFTSLMFWEEASVLGQTYATTILQPAGGSNFNADIHAVLEILLAHLGKPDSRGPSVDKMYRWHGAELQG